MGRVIYSMSVSLDGFVETADGAIDWVIVDEELHRAFNRESRNVGVFVHGRRMYELMTSYWPTAGDDPTATPVEREFARIWRDKPKVVASRTLESVGWDHTLVRDGVAEVARLRADPSLDIGVGGPTLAASLIRAGLVDEYRLYLNPVVLGAGTPFFPPDVRLDLRLLAMRVYSSGVVRLRYERR